MFRYQSGKFATYLQKTNWNRHLQNLGTVAIGLGIGLYLEFEEGDQEKYFQTVVVVLGIIALIKLAIYASWIDFNRLKGQRDKSHHSVDINGILQEIPVAVLGIALAGISSPVAKRRFGFTASAEYPDPTYGILVIIACLICCVLLASKALNFGRGGSFMQLHKVRPFLANYDWNEIFHEVASILIGIGIGLYLFETGIAFAPFEAAQKISKNFPGLQKTFGDFGGKLGRDLKMAENIVRKTPLKNKFSLQELTAGWGKKAQPYLVVGATIVGICILLKILMYLHIWDANQLRNALVGRGRRRRG